MLRFSSEQRQHKGRSLEARRRATRRRRDDAPRRSKLGTSNPGGRPGRCLQPPPLRSRFRYRRRLPRRFVDLLNLLTLPFFSFRDTYRKFSSSIHYRLIRLSDWRMRFCVLLSCSWIYSTLESLGSSLRERIQDSLVHLFRYCNESVMTIQSIITFDFSISCYC